PVRALHDQVEDAVVVPVQPGGPERDVAEDHPQPHQREGGGEAHHDRDHDERQHGEAEGGAAHGSFRSLTSATWRRRAAASISFPDSITARRDSSSTNWLLENWVSITSISSTSERREGHSPVRRHSMQRTISASPWTMTRMAAMGMTVLKW